MKECSAQDCGDQNYAKNLCRSHYDKARYSTDISKRREKCRAWYEANKEKHKTRRKELYLLNPEAARAQRHRRRQLSTSAVSEYDLMDAVDWRKFISKDPCFYCGATAGPFHVDHMLPISKGGLEVWTNLVNSCASCNLRKGAKTAEEFEEILKSEESKTCDQTSHET